MPQLGFSFIRSVRSITSIASWGLFAASLGFAVQAPAAVTQPNGDSIPVLPPQGEYDVATSRGFARSAVELNGLFAARGETLDYKADAKTSPGGFSPTCGFSGELLLRGGAAVAALGWYNVNDPVQPPTVHPLVPTSILTTKSGTQDNSATPGVNECIDAAKAAGALCGGGDSDFCPLATPSVTQPTQHCWTDVTFSSMDIKTDPNYLGGLVGFALWQNDHTKQIKYTEQKLNVPCTAAGCGPNDHWVGAVIWQSTVNPEGFYIGFEDLGMDPTDWKKIPNGDFSTSGACDGDFNDFVYFVTGVNCQGGNQACNTGLQGACSVGHTDCAADGETPACRPLVQPTDEICDNLDNNCDGLTDNDPPNGPKLCPDPAKPICFQGTCVGDCSKGEFPCPGGKECDTTTGYCVEPGCVGQSCPAGQACRNGACVDPCGPDTKCPYGQVCELGNCIDPCNGVTCPAGRVCEKGLCLADCACRGCETGLSCGADGRCTDPACATITCAATEICMGGTCVDKCQGVVCPAGQGCMNGQCSVLAGTAGAGGTGVGGGLGVGGTSLGSGGTFGVSGALGSGASAGSSGKKVTNKPAGCACRVAGPGDSGAESGALSGLGWLGALALASTVLSRRRRAGRVRAA